MISGKTVRALIWAFVVIMCVNYLGEILQEALQ